LIILLSLAAAVAETMLVAVAVVLAALSQEAYLHLLEYNILLLLVAVAQ